MTDNNHAVASARDLSWLEKISYGVADMGFNFYWANIATLLIWVYRCPVEELFGLKGDKHGLLIRPRLPNHWRHAKVTREFRGATFALEMRRESRVSKTRVTVDGQVQAANSITNVQTGKTYQVEVTLPDA